jgi:hypothetical protein
VIQHVLGKDNPRADALSRQPRYERDKIYKKQAILKEDKNRNLVLNSRIIASLTKVKSSWYEEIIQAWNQEAEVPKGHSLYEDSKLQVPDSYAKEFIQKYYSALENSHQGIRRTLWRIKQNYSIRKLPLLVKEIVTGCDTCIRNKSTHHVPYR